MELPFPVQITFHGADRSDPVEEAIRAHVENLPRFHPRIHGVRVVVSRPEGHHRQGHPYHVQVRVEVPGRELVVAHHHPRHADHEVPLIALHDAFRALERQLEEDTHVRRGRVKSRAEALAEARIARLPLAEDHGFLETPDGREVYFHRNSVLDARFDDLTVGTRVRFAEEEGARGPQASTVHVA